jgi:2-oxoglutarate dehydrogenase E2 component (dihydrolipoamide succinyltransferase)
MSVNIVVPEMGESIVDARVAKWLKQEGEPVQAGEALVELETDKVDVEVAAPNAGVLETIAHVKGDDVKIGDVLGTIAPASDRPVKTSAGREVSSSSINAPGAPPPSARAAALEDSLSSRGAAGAPAPGPSAAATPSARRLAREENVALASVKPEGPRVTKSDVEKTLAKPIAEAPQRQTTPAAAEMKEAEQRRSAPAAAAPSESAPAAARGGGALERPTAPAAAAASESASRDAAARGGGAPRATNIERVRMSKRRATIARRLVEAQQTAAMLTTFNEVDMSAVMALRERQKQAFKDKHGIGLGITSFFAKAAIAALRQFPRLNAEIQGDEMVLKHYYDIGIAVGATEGLVVPVLRDADGMTFAGIELAIREFATKARENTLTLDDLRGGTFSITNGGVFGSLMSTPILNPPQVGILGLHAIKDRPIGVGGQVVLRPMMYTALTYDHRIVDGAEAVQFLVRVKQLVEDPGVLLIES